MPPRLKSLYRKLGRIEKTFLILVVLALVLAYAVPASFIGLLVTFAVWIVGFLVAIRLARTGVRKLIWRLRNRLIVAYAFIAMVPVALILALALVSIYGLTGQIAIYLINSEMDRRTNILKVSAAGIAEAPPEHRQEAIQRTQAFTLRFFPATEILLRDTRDGSESRYPESASIATPPAGWKEANGIVVKDRRPYSWANAQSGHIAVTIMAPLSQDFLSGLLPGIGQVSFRDFSESGGAPRTPPAGAAPAARIPPKNNFLDMQVNGVSLVPVASWNSPGKKSDRGLLLVYTRMSAVLGTLFGTSIFFGDMAYGQVIWALFLIIITLFLIVELVSLVIGVSISRTITSAVHELYLGTRRVKEGDFSHRIPVRGNDQLAELGASFNTMTENLERLIVVAKEKERLESELEIAREVQKPAFPQERAGHENPHAHRPVQPRARGFRGLLRFHALRFQRGAGHRRRGREGYLGGASDGLHPVHHAHAAYRGIPRCGRQRLSPAAAVDRRDGLASEQVAVCQYLARKVCDFLLRPVRRKHSLVDLHQCRSFAAHPAAQRRARAIGSDRHGGRRVPFLALRGKDHPAGERRRAGGLHRRHDRA